MTPDFDLGRRYERSEVLEMLAAFHEVGEGNRLRQLLLVWERELRDSLVPELIIEETYLVMEPR
jgi:hypothetical protein